MWLDIIIFMAYVLMIIVIAVVTHKRTNTLSDFYMGGQGLGGWMTAFAYGTTYFSAVVFVGYAGKFGWSYGLAATWIGISNAIIGSLVAWKLLASRTRQMTRNLGVTTMPEFFEKRYEDKRIKFISGLIIFVFLIPYSASVYQGLGGIFYAVFGLPEIWAIVIMAALTLVYLVFGGYLATVLSDFIQGIIMLIGVVIMALIFLGRADWGAGLTYLTEQGLGLFPAVEGAGGGLFNSPLFNIIILCLMTSIGPLGMPQMVHKFYAIKDDNAIKKGTVISTVFALVVGGCAYFSGGIARALLSGETFASTLAGNADNIMPHLLSNLLPMGIIGIIVTLLFSASMSTLSALSLAGSSAIAVDVYKGYMKPEASEKNVTLLMRICCAGFVVVSAVLAILKIDAIVTLMSFSWGILAGCFLGPYIYGLYSKRATKAGAYASFISGIGTTVALICVFGSIAAADGGGFGAFIAGGLKNSPFIAVCAMAMSIIIVPLVSSFTKPPVSAESVVEAAKKGVTAENTSESKSGGIDENASRNGESKKSDGDENGAKPSDGKQ